jgi:hypothetical protein
MSGLYHKMHTFQDFPEKGKKRGLRVTTGIGNDPNVKAAWLSRLILMNPASRRTLRVQEKDAVLLLPHLV